MALIDGIKTITAAATAEKLAASYTNAAWLKVSAQIANTGQMWIGGSTVVAAKGDTQRGTLVQQPTGTLVDGIKVVTTAGTELPLVATSTIVGWVKLVASDANTGVIYVGSSTVVAATTDTARGAFVPEAAASPSGLHIDGPLDLNLLFVDSSISGDQVSFLYDSNVSGVPSDSSLFIPGPIDLNKVWLDSTVSGDGITFVYDDNAPPILAGT